MESQALKILIADDHEIVHDGIRLLLRNYPEFEIVHTALNGEAALAYLANHSIDILITDISMPQMDGIELTRQVKSNYSEVKVLVLTVHHDNETVRTILGAEAEGYILKNTGTKQLVMALSSVAAGDTFYSQEIIGKIVKGLASQNKKENSTAALSPRELEILQLVVDELTTNAIAEKLFLSPKTVDTHRKNILKKTGMKSIVGLIKYAILHELVIVN